MALGHGPTVVTDGLVLALDAGDTNSYPGSGSAWYDISSSQSSGNIESDPTFSSNNGGYFDFDGTDDVIDFRFGQNGPDLTLSTITVSAWVNFDSATWVMGNGAQFRIRLNGTAIGFWIRELNDGGANELTSPSSTMSTGEWGNVVGTYDGTNQKIYHNGVEVASTNPGLGFLDAGSNNLAIGESYYGSNQFFNGKLSATSIYNRALTASEIKQNFNALRGRFSI